MDNFLEFASSRRSIRKFEDKEIPTADVEYFIKAAVTAPSGCNSQCWRFVAITDKEIINRIAQVVTQKMEEVLECRRAELTEQYFTSKGKMASFFTNAPVVIAVFMTHLEYYDPEITAALKEKGLDYEERMRFFACPDVLSIGAAIQNLLLAVQEKGYGACWMNEPSVAGREIGEILGEPAEHKFMSLIPVGIPAYIPRGKKMKDMEEVFIVK